MRILGVLGIVVCMMSCDLSGGEVIISTVQPGLTVDLANPLDTESDFALRFTTIDEVCGSSRLLADGIVQDDKIYVEVSGLMIPSTCDLEKTNIDKDVEMHLGVDSYDFHLTVGDGLRSLGSLDFDGETYRLALESEAGISLGHSELHKIPESIVWGTLSSETNSYDIYQDLLTAIGPLQAPLDLKEGYYGHFTIDDGSNVSLTETISESNTYTYPFIVRLSTDTDVLASIIEHFRYQYGSSIDISCTTWEGDAI